MYLFLVLFILQFSGCFGCIPTPTVDEAPVPILPCSTCAAPSFTDVPATAMDVEMGDGSITAGALVGPGCVTFVVTCDADGGDFVVIGANMDFISLSAAGVGAKTATLVCNADGQLEGRTVPAGDPVIVTSVYCSNAE